MSCDKIKVYQDIIVEKDWLVLQLDITVAYLNGKLNETVYMEQPQLNLIEKPDKEVCLLKKKLCSLNQFGREWNLCLDGFMKSVNLEDQDLIHMFTSIRN